MKISVSFLKSRYSFFKTLSLLENSPADYLHVDVMDGLFVNNRTPFCKEQLDDLKESKKPKEVHLMTLHLKKFVDVFSYIEPEIIVYEFEATTKHNALISYIKEKKCKVGIAISPLTDLDLLKPYLKKIDMVLVMSVIPGYGGQKFIPETIERIEKLKDIRKEKKLKFLIHVDGGVNEETIRELKKVKPDRVVVGSYVCEAADFNKQIEKLREM